MSRILRQKHVFRERMMDDFELPKSNQEFVRIIRCCGNNLHEVESADVECDNFLVSMPSKYRKSVWVKRGDIVLVEPIEEGKKVKAEICKILTSEHIKEYKKAGIWPEVFDKKDNYTFTNGTYLEWSHLMSNRNRQQQHHDVDDINSDENDEICF